MASFTSGFWPDVEQVLEQIDVLVKLDCRLKIDVAAVRRRTDDRRSEARGQVERCHLVDIRTHRHALQVIQQVRQSVLQFHTSLSAQSSYYIINDDIQRCRANSHVQNMVFPDDHNY